MFIVNKIFAANKASGVEDGNKLIEKFIKLKTRKLSKSRKLSKLGKLKSEKLIKSKKLSKIRNCPNFGIGKIKLSFLISNTKIIFNCL